MLRAAAAPLLAALVLAAPAEARPGDLDPTFAGGGRTALVVGDSNTTPSALSLIAGFRPLVAVRAENKGRLLPMLLRFTGGGASGGRILLPAATDGAAVLDGSRWLVGLAPKTEDSTQLALSGGSVFTLPGATGRYFNPVAFRVDAAGRLLAVGSGVGSVGGSSDAIAVRFLPDGRLDPAYGVVVLAPDTRVIAGLITSDGRPYVLGATDQRGETTATVVAGREGIWRDRGLLYASSLIEGPGGTLLVAGGGQQHAWLVRLRRGLQRDSRFRIVKPRDMIISALARDRQDRIVVAGARRSGHPQAKFLRLTRRGATDRSFRTTVKQLGSLRGVHLVASEVSNVVIDTRGRIVAAGVTYDDEYVGRDDVGRAYLAVARLKG